MRALPYWPWSGDDRPTQELDDEISEELQLHLDLLAEEELRKGSSHDEAKTRAAERFGDFDTILRRCRVEKQGDTAMLRRIQAALIVLLVLGMGAIGWQQYVLSANVATNQQAMSDTLNKLREGVDSLSLAMVRPSAPDGSHPATWQVSSDWSKEAEGQDLFASEPDQPEVLLRVVDESGDPIPDAQLRFTWTDGDWTDTYEVGVDAQGEHRAKLRFEGKQLEGVYAHAAGHTFVSEIFKWYMPPEGALVLTLPRSVTQRVSIVPAEQNSRGQQTDPETTDEQTITNGQVWRLSRTDKKGKYHDCSLTRPIQLDAEGTATLDQFAAGDRVTLNIQVEGTSYLTDFFVIGEDAAEPIVVRAKPNLMGGLGGRGGLGGGGGMF